MNFIHKFQLKDDFVLVLPDSGYTLSLFDTVEKNREYLAPFVDWVNLIRSKKETQYFLERNLRGYRELMAGQISVSNHPGFSFFIYKDEECVGMVGYQGISLKNSICALGYWIAQDYQGQGLTHLAMKKVIEYAFSVLMMNRIEIQCAVDNFPSIKVAEKLGFMREATLRQVEKRNDKFVDHHLFSTLKEEQSQN